MTVGLGAQQDSSRLTRLLAEYRIKTSIGLQLWSTYSAGMDVYDAATGTYTHADNRLNTQLRRSRFVFTGQPYERLQFNITAALDLVGHDLLSATEAAGNNAPSPGFRLWNLWLQYRLSKQPDRLYLLTGYFLPPVGRESSTAALRSTSFEKAWSQNYLRRHLTGSGPGRASGLLLGGQWHAPDDDLHLTYEAALQNPTGQDYNGNSSGINWSPLLSARLSVQLGDVESKTFTLLRRVNYFNQREGITLSLSAARQGETAAFGRMSTLGVEVLYSTAGFHLDGDYHFLRRNVAGGNADTRTAARTGYLRLGYNLPLAQERILEPVVSYWFFRGPTSPEAIFRAQLTRSFTGSDIGLDLGANLYLNANFKLSLFYAYRHGDAGESDPAEINNNFFQQVGVGPVRRGNYLGTGCVVIF
ncbi:porin [Lewinella sp. IMCC34183]|uniref:porin n=1 Tax=Lewinella sp. IMCC34183 TaxID=2248762 RepID=UPI0013007110|nr:porin [Lewinella sp. IMCC34183]